MQLTDILICPRTGNRLRFDDGDSVVRVEHSDVTYPIVDGIVDFCPDVKDTISRAYDAFSSCYDAYMTFSISPGMFMRMFDRLVWGFSGDGGIIDDIASELEGFTIRQQGNFESFAWFEAVKKAVATLPEA